MLTESTWVLVKRSWLTWGPAYLVRRQAGSLREASLMSPGLGPQVNLNLLRTAPLTEEEVPFLFFQHQKTTTSNPRLAPPCRQNNETGGLLKPGVGWGPGNPRANGDPSSRGSSGLQKGPCAPSLQGSQNYCSHQPDQKKKTHQRVSDALGRRVGIQECSPCPAHSENRATGSPFGRLL